MKIQWKKPELIILYRGQPEEHLIDLCKSVNVGGGAQNIRNKCDMPHGQDCGGCLAQPDKGGS